MQVSEVVEMKANLEQQITDLVCNFEKMTNTILKDFHIIKVKGIDKRDVVLQIKTIIEL